MSDTTDNYELADRVIIALRERRAMASTILRLKSELQEEISRADGAENRCLHYIKVIGEYREEARKARAVALQIANDYADDSPHDGDGISLYGDVENIRAVLEIAEREACNA